MSYLSINSCSLFVYRQKINTPGTTTTPATEFNGNMPSISATPECYCSSLVVNNIRLAHNATCLSASSWSADQPISQLVVLSLWIGFIGQSDRDNEIGKETLLCRNEDVR